MTKLRPVKNIQIAIDGPAGAGKSTIALLLSKRLNLTYIDTGSMYRTVALLAAQNKIKFTDETKIIAKLKQSTIKLMPPKNTSRYCTVVLSSREVTRKLRTQKISWGSSVVATLPKIRKHLVTLQKQLAKKQSVVMEGRDITSVVLPNADLKIFMTASVESRAKRRHLELTKKGNKQSFSTTLTETKKRDQQDSSRKADPLKVVPGAWLLKTTNLTIDQVVDKIVERLHELNLVA